MSHPRLFRCLLLILISLAVWPASAQKNKTSTESERILWMHTPMPLGADNFVLEPSGQHFAVLSCIEDRRFNRLEISRVQKSPFVIDAAGNVWKNYPDEVTFRVTATGMVGDLTLDEPYKIHETADLNSFFLGLRFRLKAFRGLNVQMLQPSRIQMIGMPRDIPYKERVYRVSFDTGELPVDDRLVMEVLSPKGQLLSRFHLELE